MYGLAELLPGQLTVDTWRTADGKSYIKGLQDQIKIGGLDYNVTKQNALTILNAFFEMVNSDGETIVSIDGLTGKAMFGKGAHVFNADGSLNLANGNFLYDLINGLSITGGFESNADGNRIVIDPNRRVISFVTDGQEIAYWGFDNDERGMGRLKFIKDDTECYYDTAGVLVSNGEIYSECALGRVAVGKIDVTDTTGFRASVQGNGNILEMIARGLPTSETSLNVGQLWNDNGTLKIVQAT